MAKRSRAGLSSFWAFKWQHFCSLLHQRNPCLQNISQSDGHVGNVNLLAECLTWCTRFFTEPALELLLTHPWSL